MSAGAFSKISAAAVPDGAEDRLYAIKATAMVGTASAIGHASQAHFRASWKLEGDGTKVEIHAVDGQFDPPLALVISGEWEWEEFAAFVALVARQIRRRNE